LFVFTFISSCQKKANCGCILIYKSAWNLHSTRICQFPRFTVLDCLISFNYFADCSKPSSSDEIDLGVLASRYLLSLFFQHLSASEDELFVQASFQHTTWSVGPVACGVAKKQGFLNGGDVLRLFHGHMDDCLTTPSNEDKQLPVRYMRLCMA